MLGLAAVLLTPVAHVWAATPAGTAIRNVAAGHYQLGAVAGSATSNEVVTTVALTPAVALTPTSAVGSVPAGRTYYFAHTVVNGANGAETFDLSASNERGWPVILFRDDNDDGIHQSDERAEVTDTGSLAAGQAFRFFCAASVPNGVAVRTSSLVTVVARSRSASAVSDRAENSLVVGGNGIIKGLVKWSSRAAAVGVEVVALADDETVALDATSSTGSFELTGLAAGTYAVQITGEGMVPQCRDGVVVEEGGSATCDFTAMGQPQFGSGLQLITVPFDYQDGDPAAVTGASGLKLAWWDPKRNHYLVYGTDLEFPPLACGRGFWLQTSGGAPLSSLATPGAAPSQTQEFAISLSPGWNLIGAPFATPAAWANSRVRRSGQTVDLATAGANEWIRPYLWGYSAQSGQYVLVHATYPEAQRTLDPWQGYWIRALVACELLVAPPSAAAAAPVAAPAPAFKPSANNWRVRLVAAAGSKTDTFNLLGVAPDASSPDPMYRLASPPPSAQSVDLAFVSDARAEQATGWATDIRPPQPGKMIWTFRVATDLPGAPVTLTWPDLSQVPAQYRVTLLDLDARRRQYMRTTTGYTFNSGAGGGERTFQIEFDPTPWARLQVAGMRQMAPAAQGATVSYNLSADAVVTAQVRTLSGRAVRLLCANAALSAGTHLLSWDGRDGSGRMMPAGPYLCEISAVTDEGQAVKGMRTIFLAR